MSFKQNLSKLYRWKAEIMKRLYIRSDFKYNFSRFTNRIFEKFPRRSPTLGFIILNASLTTLYMLSHPDKKAQYSANPILRQLISSSPFRLIIDNAIIYFMGTYLEANFSRNLALFLYVAAPLLSTFSGSNKRMNNMNLDSVTRALAFSIIIRQPNTSFMILPFPFPINAKIVAAIMIVFDVLLSQNMQALSGMIIGSLSKMINL